MKVAPESSSKEKSPITAPRQTISFLPLLTPSPAKLKLELKGAEGSLNQNLNTSTQHSSIPFQQASASPSVVALSSHCHIMTAMTSCLLKQIHLKCNLQKRKRQFTKEDMKTDKILKIPAIQSGATSQTIETDCRNSKCLHELQAASATSVAAFYS